MWTADEAREVDRLSSEVYEIPSSRLMEEAGQAVFRLALSLWKPYRKFLVLAGTGNNGGDALVVARELKNRGFNPLLIRPDDGYSLPADLADFIVIDGLVGIGLKAEIREGKLKELLLSVAGLHPQFVVAIDIPSGMKTDVWEQDPPLLSPTHTITFGSYKPLHLQNPSRKYCGILSCENIGFSQQAIKVVAPRFQHFTAAPSLKEIWSFLPADAHKFDRGHVLCIGGSPGKVGAILIAAEAAWKAGAGWVTVAPLSEVMAPSWPRNFTYETFGIEGELLPNALKKFVETRKVKAVLIGPGTMQNPLTRQILEDLAELQKQKGLRLIFDAGALDDFLEMSRGIDFRAADTLLTPHPGEWRRLKKGLLPIAGIRDVEASMELCKNFSIIYKSSTPIILSEREALFLSEGDNTLAKAGSGDILAGVILGLAASPRPLNELAALAQNLIACRKINLPEQ